MANLYKFSPLISVKSFGNDVMSTVSDKDTSNVRNVMDEKWVSSQMGITRETLTELKDVCRYCTCIKFVILFLIHISSLSVL